MASAVDFHLAVFRRLAAKQGLLPGALHGGRRGEFVVAMSAAALAFESGRDYDEAAVNDRLRAWLAGPGAMLATDHVELRRFLVDCALLERDGYGRRYRRSEPTGDWAAALSALSGIDLVAEAATYRAAGAAHRAARKAAWAARSRTAEKP